MLLLLIVRWMHILLSHLWVCVSGTVVLLWRYRLDFFINQTHNNGRIDELEGLVRYLLNGCERFF